jgi:FKBP-type peptidyl-prolyl cis-trans isomerase FklB
MKKRFIMVVSLLATVAMVSGGACAQQTPATTSQQPSPAKAQKPAAPETTQTPEAASPAAPVFNTDKEKESYALGMNIGRGLSEQAKYLDLANLFHGLQDGLSGGKTLLTDAEAQEALAELRNEVSKEHEAQLQQTGEANMKEGQEFLASNKTKDGVVTLPSGLQYKILTAGTGAKPTASDTVVCNYRGTFINGTEFDSSYKRGQPASFPVGHVIKGWTQALQLMPVGSKWQLFVPSDLAYGARGAGGVIGPNATLIFEVELLSIQGKQ